jgi:hypothetical protein
MWGNGRPVVIDWSYFTKSASFVQSAKNLPVNKPSPYRNTPNTDMFYALGTFTVTRTSSNCYAIFDHYDFTPSREVKKALDTVLTLPHWTYQLSGSREFDVHASGRL